MKGLVIKRRVRSTAVYVDDTAGATRKLRELKVAFTRLDKRSGYFYFHDRKVARLDGDFTPEQLIIFTNKDWYSKEKPITCYEFRIDKETK